MLWSMNQLGYCGSADTATCSCPTNAAELTPPPKSSSGFYNFFLSARRSHPEGEWRFLRIDFHASRCDAHCAPSGRGCRRRSWNRRSARASARRATGKRGWWSTHSMADPPAARIAGGDLFAKCLDGPAAQKRISRGERLPPYCLGLDHSSWSQRRPGVRASDWVH
jgi:hypothetical protein